MGALDYTLGACLLGVVVSAILYGVTCVQTWYYYSGYPSDPWYIKLLVAGVLMLDTCNQALISHATYIYLVTNFGVQEALGDLVWSLIVSAFFTGTTALFVQSFWAVHVYRLSNKSWLATGSVMTLVIGEFVLLLVYTTKATHFQTFAQLAAISAPMMVVDGVGAAANVLITVFLSYLLQPPRTGFRRSKTIIDKLTMFSLNTSLLVSVCGVAILVTVAVWPDSFIYFAFNFCISRLYCNSLLATLNARKTLLKGESDTDEMSSLCVRGAQQERNSSMIGTVATEGSSKDGVERSSQRVPNDISIEDRHHTRVRRGECAASGSSGDARSRPEVV